LKAEWSDLRELENLGTNLRLARLDRGLSQGQVARESKLTQAQVSLFEAGRRLPSLDQFVRLARTLDVPIQKLLTGKDRPGIGLKDLAVELRRLGAVDLWVADAIVPGAARRPEEVIALAASGSHPDPRVVETLPTLLSWNALSPPLLRAYGVATRTKHRLAWLADVALTIDRQKGFPGGCQRERLEQFLRTVGSPGREGWDGLGSPAETPPRFPAWRRWRISYAATPEQFEERARELSKGRSVGEQFGLVLRSIGELMGRPRAPTERATLRKRPVRRRPARKGRRPGKDGE
jgi:transcriptional regulator with XRE-family HTH domain